MPYWGVGMLRAGKSWDRAFKKKTGTWSTVQTAKHSEKVIFETGLDTMLSGSGPDRLHHCAYVWYKEAKVSGYHRQREKRIRRGEGASPRERERESGLIGLDQISAE